MTIESKTTDYEIYDMQLGDAIDVRGHKVTRVPGGWLWHTSPHHATFIEFHNEFMTPERRGDDNPF